MAVLLLLESKVRICMYVGYCKELVSDTSIKVKYIRTCAHV